MNTIIYFKNIDVIAEQGPESFVKYVEANKKAIRNVMNTVAKMTNSDEVLFTGEWIEDVYYIEAIKVRSSTGISNLAIDKLSFSSIPNCFNISVLNNEGK